jgi:hypothetical protein
MPSEANEAMSDAISPAPGASGAPNGPVKRRGGGNLSQMFPNGFKIWLDDDLLQALERAARLRKTRTSIVARDWLRDQAIALGVYRASE